MKRMHRPGTILRTTPPFRHASRPRAARMGLGARMAVFARQRMARLARMLHGPSSSASMVYRRREASAFYQTLQQRLSLSVQPRLTLVFRAAGIDRPTTESPAQPVASTRIAPPAPLPLVLPSPAWPSLKPIAAPAWGKIALPEAAGETAPLEAIRSAQTAISRMMLHSVQTVERLMAREKRLDLVQGNPPQSGIAVASFASPVTSPAVPQSRPVPRITRAQQAVNHPGAEEFEEPARPFHPTGRQPQPAWGSPTAALPDLNRLADQVVQVIDQRMVAHRERMGRI